MRRGKGILASLRLGQSFLQTQNSATRSFNSQMTRYLHISPLFSSCLSKRKLSNYDFLSTHQSYYFSSLSKPDSIVELIKSSEWSENLEMELEKSHPTLNHGTVLYVLMNLEGNPQQSLVFFNWLCDKSGFKPSLIVYSKMLRVLGSKEFLNQFWILAKRMSDQGCDVDDKTYRVVLHNFKSSKMISEAKEWKEYYTKVITGSSTKAIVEHVVNLMLGSDCYNDVKETLGELKVDVLEDTILRILWSLYGNPLKALSFFSWLKKHMDYTHTAVTYNGILRILAQKESIKEFWSMIEEMKSAGHDIDVDTYIKIGRMFERSKMTKDSVELYELMMNSPYKPPLQFCSLLLKEIALSNTPDINLVFRVVNKYKAGGHALSKNAYDWLYRSLTSVGKLDEARKTLEAMRNAGFELDNFTCCHGLVGLSKAGRLDEALKLLEKMELEGCVPDKTIWSTLIREFCTIGEVDQALKYFTKMWEKNCEVNAKDLEILVNALCGSSRLDNAYTLFIEWVEKAKVRPFQSTCQALIKKLLGERKLAEALNLLRFMKNQNLGGFPSPFVDYISKVGTVEDAWEFLKASGVNQKPYTSDYLHVIQSLFKEGRESDARGLLDQCPYHIQAMMLNF